MKYLNIYLFTLGFIGLLNAQIIVDTSTLPEAGDTLIYSNFEAFEDTSAYRQSGENISWVFDGFNIVGQTVEGYADITGTALADSFPEANILLDYQGVTSPGRRTANALELIALNTGGFGGGFGGIDINADFGLGKPYIIKQRPLNFGQSFNDGFDVNLSISADSIPGIDQFPLPIPGATIDSIRINIGTTREEKVIGWGTATLFNHEKEVLQMVSTESMTVGIEIGISAFNNIIWFPLIDFFPEFGMLGGEPVVTYCFISADSKHTFVEFSEFTETDTSGVTTIANVRGRISGEVISSTDELSFKEGGYLLYPNPSNDFIRITPSNKKSETLSLEIYSFSGQLMYNDKTYKSDSKIMIEDFISGPYLMRLESENQAYNTIFQVQK